MIACCIRYEIEPTRAEAFAEYARRWGEAIPRCGADLVGYYGPHEGSAQTAYGLYEIADLAAYEAYRAKLRDDPVGRENYRFAQAERFIRREDRLFLKRLCGPGPASSGRRRLRPSA